MTSPWCICRDVVPWEVAWPRHRVFKGIVQLTIFICPVLQYRDSQKSIPQLNNQCLRELFISPMRKYWHPPCNLSCCFPSSQETIILKNVSLESCNQILVLLASAKHKKTSGGQDCTLTFKSRQHIHLSETVSNEAWSCDPSGAIVVDRNLSPAAWAPPRLLRVKPCCMGATMVLILSSPELPGGPNAATGSATFLRGLHARMFYCLCLPLFIPLLQHTHKRWYSSE